jgi:DNA-binding NtrC family response regulator
MERASILIADDKENMLRLLQRILGEAYEVRAVADGAQALELLAAQRFDVVLTDVRMPGADGLAVLRATRQRAPDTAVILMTAYASIPSAVEAVREGAYDYLQKPFDPDDVTLVVARALEHRQQRLRSEPPAVSLAPEGVPPEAALLQRPYREAVDLARDQASREYLAALLAHFRGNVTHAAEHAGMERESLHRLLKRYGLRSEDYKGTS